MEPEINKKCIKIQCIFRTTFGGHFGAFGVPKWSQNRQEIIKNAFRERNGRYSKKYGFTKEKL